MVTILREPRTSPPAYPSGLDNLVTVFHLERLVASVARTDVNGNKINKVRKSYQSLIEDLPGENPVPPKNRFLMDLLSSSMDDGRLVLDFEEESLVEAFTLRPGPVPGHDPETGTVISDSRLRGLTPATGGVDSSDDGVGLKRRKKKKKKREGDALENGEKEAKRRRVEGEYAGS